MILALADDDPHFLGLLEHWLARRGHQVHSFRSGEEMVHWARQSGQPVDAVVLDIDMPGRSGLDSAGELRSLHSYADTPVMFVSAVVGAALRRRILTERSTWAMQKDANLWRSLDECLAKLRD